MLREILNPEVRESSETEDTPVMKVFATQAALALTSLSAVASFMAA